MSLDIGNRSRPDGPLHYRYDHSADRRVAVLPATCKRRVHSLADFGYRAIESNGVLSVSCNACSAIPNPDHAWRLTMTPPAPRAAELDDAPYVEIKPVFIERPVSRSTTHPHRAPS